MKPKKNIPIRINISLSGNPINEEGPMNANDIADITKHMMN